MGADAEIGHGVPFLRLPRAGDDLDDEGSLLPCRSVRRCRPAVITQKEEQIPLLQLERELFLRRCFRRQRFETLHVSRVPGSTGLVHGEVGDEARMDGFPLVPDSRTHLSHPLDGVHFALQQSSEDAADSAEESPTELPVGNGRDGVFTVEPGPVAAGIAFARARDEHTLVHRRHVTPARESRHYLPG
ncbi:MAG: hypothetical protein CME15_07815 [Gemmatimonadetes bacterium]|nr:hypothetical protein [Gemmatimonadota bacterium]